MDSYGIYTRTWKQMFIFCQYSSVFLDYILLNKVILGRKEYL